MKRASEKEGADEDEGGGGPPNILSEVGRAVRTYLASDFDDFCHWSEYFRGAMNSRPAYATPGDFYYLCLVEPRGFPSLNGV
jgi:hypothetical protein